MTMRVAGGAGAALSLILWAGCSRDEDAAADAPSRNASLSPRKPAAAPGKTAASAPPATRAPRAERGPVLVAPDSEAPIAIERPLFARLPSSTIGALRLPRLDLLGTAAQRTAMQELLDSPQFAALREPAQASLDQAFAELRRQSPELLPLLDELKQSTGELVIAWLGLDPLAFSGSGVSDRFPVTLALLHDARSGADRLDHLLDQAIASASGRVNGASLELVARTPHGWLRRLRHDGLQLDFERDGTTFTLKLGPDTGSDERPLPPLALGESFAATDVVRACAPTRAAATPIVEGFLHLESVWQLCQRVGTLTLGSILTDGGFTSIRGVAASCSLAETGLDECIRLVAPEGKDLLSAAFTARQLDAALARWLPADASYVSLQSFDLAGTYERVMALLPVAARTEFEQQLGQLATRDGFDLKRDVIQNLGPTFATIGGGDLLTAMRSATAPEFALAIELQDGARLRRVVEQAMRASGMGTRTRTRALCGQLITRCEPVPLPLGEGGRMVSLVPQWWIGDQALLFSTSDRAMEQMLTAGKDEKARGPAPVRDALAAQGEHLFGLTYDETLGDLGLTLARRTATGLELRSCGGKGAMTLVTAALLTGVVPAIAIPKLLVARIEANEQAAIANLQAIGSAQALFHEQARVDSDGDGHGEYATLAELTGAAAARGGGSKESRPLASERLRPDESGTAECNGYRYRIDLPMALRRGGGPIPVVVAERAELEFVAYAWPVQPGTTGNRVFALDAEGSLWTSDNRGEQQGYSGLARMPPQDASEERDRAERVSGVTAVRRGRDAGVWLELK